MFKKFALAGALCCALFALSPSASAQSFTPYSNVQTCTASAVALPSKALVNGIVLKADVANTGVIYIGAANVTTATGYPLKAGEAISYGPIGIANISAIYMICGNTTDVLHFTGN
jgi:hypothetical protein